MLETEPSSYLNTKKLFNIIPVPSILKEIIISISAIVSIFKYAKKINWYKCNLLIGANTYLVLQNYDACIQDCDKAISIDAGFIKVNNILDFAFYNKCIIFFSLIWEKQKLCWSNRNTKMQSNALSSVWRRKQIMLT